MSLTDNEKLKDRKYKRRSVNDKWVNWSDNQKIEAVTTYLLLGNVRHTAAALKIPDPTLRYWRGCDWWKEIEQDIKANDRIVLSNRLKQIVDNSLDLIEDRIEKGDFIYDQKTGKMKRKPLQARDVHKIAVDFLDRREGLDMHKEIVQNQESIQDKLNKLAQSFSDLATGKKNISAEDAVIIENEGDSLAVHEEWEEGLQDGIREVSLETGAEEESK